MRIVLIAMLVALSGASAWAQGRSNQSMGPQKPQKQEQETPEQRKKQDQDYKDALSRIPAKPPADPWGKMR